MRKKQISHAIRLFKVRITGQNEGFNSKVGVLSHSFRNRGWISNQRRAGASAYKDHAPPEIGGYFLSLANAPMQSRHTALSFGVEPCESFLRSGDRVVVDIANQII